MTLPLNEMSADQLWNLLQVIADQQIRQTAHMLNRVPPGDDFDFCIELPAQIPQVLLGLAPGIMAAE
jgi:hypothetical protein